MKFVKKILVVLLFVSFFVINPESIEASGFNVYSSASSVNPGQTFYVSLSNVAGEFNISVLSGNASGGGSTGFIDTMNGAASFPITAGSSGTIQVRVTATAAGTFVPEADISGRSRDIYVKINSPQAQKPTTPQRPTSPQTPQNPVSPVDQETPQLEEEEVKDEPVLSADNTLKSIKLSKGSLYPKFKASRTNYSVVLPKGTKEIDVKAVTNHSKARVANTGKHKLKLGENVISLIVTPENGGSEELYKLKVYVEDELEHEISYGEDSYKVVDHFYGVKIPATFEKSKVKHMGKELSALKSKVWNATLLYLEGPDKKREFYLVESGDLGENGLQVISKFRLVSVNGDDYLLLEVPEAERERLNMNYESFKIGKEEFTGFTYKDKDLKDFKVIYLQDKKGNKFYYQYDAKEKTWQRKINHVAVSEDEYLEELDKLNKDISTYRIGMYLAVGLLLLLQVVRFILSRKKDY